MKIDRVINQAIWEHQANSKGFPNNEYLIELEKIRKVLEIIKEKRVNVRCLMSGWKLGTYNSYKAHEKLTQEEYDLLKEIFL